jgi:hypothetical protein
MQLAHGLWDATPRGAEATEETWQRAYDATMHQVRDELRAIWSALSPSQRRALTAIAENTSPLYGVRREHGGSRGGTVRAAVRALEDRGEITADPAARTRHRVVDPLLAAWILEGREGV